ncbi:S-adenosyl-L-methionine-dependent methyltransferase [Tothia fuscella]|uniref:tRNA (uracil(54)-C(5))-methyltransferase n=1 Tax=Tothia fuscella TaxID=1048955 RepID=A0A9P4NNL0_9PEZI|nr:S-adenosyl-L-methionine-dependent methyltransferase [Tothia fuscella]
MSDSAAALSAPQEARGEKRPYSNGQKSNQGKRGPQHKKQKKKEKQGTEGSNEEVLLIDIQNLLKKHSLQDKLPNQENGVSKTDPKTSAPLPESLSEIELTISELSSTGDSLAYDEATKRAYIVPFSVPGDVVLAKIIRHQHNPPRSITDFIKVIKPSAKRDDSLIKCPYFASCSGCQFQMMAYPDQLAHKRRIVEKAFQNFSNLDPALVPAVGDTIGSPLEYGYRTKLTPHFDGPPSGRRDRRNGVKVTWPEIPPIGFMKKGTRHTIDIEDCPIGTDAVRMGMRRERKRVTETIDTYSRGATVLLRESTTRIPKDDPQLNEKTEPNPDIIFEDRGPHIHAKKCITDSNATSTEYINDFQFENPAGSFFQNNNSILPIFTDYIRSHILPPSPPETETSPSPKITNLIDAYSGSGLFTITLSALFKSSIGIDISPQSITSASKNLTLNNIPTTQAKFIAADATNLFASITFLASETVVVIDPPRKGCDQDFLTQLLRYGPERVVYVSCNVHTQARDVGILVGGIEGVEVGDVRYDIESLRGFDFFPQTGHVEGVCVLSKRKAVGADHKEDIDVGEVRGKADAANQTST